MAVNDGSPEGHNEDNVRRYSTLQKSWHYYTGENVATHTSFCYVRYATMYVRYVTIHVCFAINHVCFADQMCIITLIGQRRSTLRCQPFGHWDILLPEQEDNEQRVVDKDDG